MLGVLGLLVGAPAAAHSEAGVTQSEDEPVTLTFWWMGTETDVAEAAVEAFETANPNVDVELSYYSFSDFSNAMPAALAAGNPPDVTFGDPTAPNAPNYVEAGQLLQLDDIAAERGWADRLQEGAMTFYNPLYGGGTYGIPLASALRGVFYNEAILEEIGAEVPTTLDEFEAVLAAVKEAGYTPLAMGNLDKYGVDYYWLGLLLNYLSDEDWESFVEGTQTHQPGVPWGGEAVEQALQKLLKWIDLGYFNSDFPALNSDDLPAGFLDGSTFAVANGTNLNPGLIDAAPEFEIGFMNWPALNESTANLYISDPGKILMIPTDSAHPDEAVELIDFLLTPEVGDLFAADNRIPLHQLDPADVEVSVPFIEDQLATASTQTQVGWLNYMAPFEFADLQGSELQRLLAGETDLADSLEFLQQAYDDAIANAE